MFAPHLVLTAKRPVSSATAKLAQAATAICFGLVIIGFVGFAHIEVVHSAAHDTRHANAFPCH